MMAKTVGELKKLLEEYPDDLEVVYMDNEGEYNLGFDIVARRPLGVFVQGGYEVYLEYKLYQSQKWQRDVEVLVLG